MIVLLALAWAVVLVPATLKPRFESSPIDGVRDFERSMGILANTRHEKHDRPGRWVMVPKDMPEAPKRRRNRVIRRRRQNFVRLVMAAAGTLILGLIPALRVLLTINLVVDVILVLYIVQLRRWRRAEIERAHIVRTLPIEQPAEPLRERSSG